jgi:hypothetical protein
MQNKGVAPAVFPNQPDILIPARRIGTKPVAASFQQRRERGMARCFTTLYNKSGD